MTKYLIISIGMLFCNVSRAQTQTLQTVTTSGNSTGNAIRLSGEGNIGSSGGGELVLGLLTTPMTNDTRNFIGWKHNINTITDGLAGTLLLQGRSDIANVPIDFATGQGTPQLRMRVAGNGNVGIGSDDLAPFARLMVKGSGNTGSTTSFLVQNNSNIKALQVLDNGHVGIGNAVSNAFPQSKLGIYTPYGEALSSDITLEKSIATGEIGAIRFATGYLNPVDHTPFWAGIQSYATGGLDQIDLRFYTSVGSGQLNLERMRIDQYGNIGINTSTPDFNAKLTVNGNMINTGKVAIGTDLSKVGSYSLAVNGDAIFNKAVVKLYSSWPDYVFTPTYKLPRLDSLEQFIKLNGHLPEVPKAEEIEKNGIDLGSNQALLLKKIEELTLIVIEQNKRIEKLEKERNNKTMH